MSLDREHKQVIVLRIADEEGLDEAGNPKVTIAWTFDPPIKDKDSIPRTPAMRVFAQAMRHLQRGGEAPILRDPKAKTKTETESPIAPADSTVTRLESKARLKKLTGGKRRPK